MIQNLGKKLFDKNELDLFSISHYLLLYANQGGSIKDFLREALEIILKYSKCEKIEIHLEEKKKFYFCEIKKSPHKNFLFSQKSENPLLKRKTTKPNTKNIILFDLIIAGFNIGNIIYKKTSAELFSKEEKSDFKNIVNTLSIALAHRRVQVDARERVKELVCLYGISKISVKQNLTIDEMLEEIVLLLPPGWLYPSAAGARIELDGKSYRTKGYKKTKQIQSADIIIRSEKRGVIELVYVKEMPENDIGPFLNEEWDLIDAIAKEVSFIIERKISEVEKSKLQEQLRHADRLSTIGKLAAGVAHELNEPIGNILGFAQLIQKNDLLPEIINRDIKKIINASLYTRDIIRQLLIFARMMPSKMAHTDINDIVRDTISFLEARCSKEGIKVIKELSSDYCKIEADASQMTQILVNLIVNAIDAMPLGGKLLIKTLTDKENVILTVEDNGVGMSEDVIKHIYLPFFTTKDIGQGTGLGMSVVHGIVTAHRGTISLQSAVGKGTRFIVSFPKLKK